MHDERLSIRTAIGACNVIDEESAVAVDVHARKAMDQRAAGDLHILQIGRAIRSPPFRDREPPARDDVSVHRSRADETAGPADDER
jgi:hypothetical protein